MNKRDTVLSVASGQGKPGYIPAAFFSHFDPAYHQGQAAVDKHLEYFAHTGNDILKVQYELPNPPMSVKTPQDWANMPRCTEDFFAPALGVIKGVLAAKQKEALVILTVYSPFMWSIISLGNETVDAHMKENPEACKKGLEILTANVVTLLKGAKKLGIDGFYASTEGGEAYRFPGTDIFKKYIKPSDMVVWDTIKDCTFNILHVCDYQAPYEDLTPFLDYPGHIVNIPLHLSSKKLTPSAVATMFGRPFMGGMERKAALASGPVAAIKQEAEDVLRQKTGRFILGADCTVPNANWDYLRAATDAAHNWR